MRRDPLLEHLPSSCEERWWYLNAERSRRLQVDDELEPGRLQDWEVGGLLSLEDAARLSGTMCK
jgi:hypothetical protein